MGSLLPEQLSENGFLWLHHFLFETNFQRLPSPSQQASVHRDFFLDLSVLLVSKMFNVYPCPRCLTSGSLNLEIDVAITQAPHLSNSGPSLGLCCALNHRAHWQACKWSHFSLLFKLMKGNVSFLKCVHGQTFLEIRKRD